MRLLLDTQAFLWWMAGSPRLSAPAREAIVDPANVVHFSIASAWEIEIKRAIGKLRAPLDLAAAIKTEGFDLLPVDLRHIAALAGLPAHHRDPFDRMLLRRLRSKACGSSARTGFSATTASPRSGSVSALPKPGRSPI